MWGRAESCKSKSVRPAVLVVREAEECVHLGGNTTAVIKEQWIRAQGQHPVAASREAGGASACHDSHL